MSSTFEIKVDSGLVMKGTYWPAENAKANFCFITGMQEYSMRYDRMAKWMNEKGINVWVLDHFGQGLNAASVEDQQKWPLNAFDMTVEGLNKLCLMAKENGLPTTQGGHSMGSFMTQARLEKYPHAADRTLIIGSNGGQAGLMKIAYVLSCVITTKKNWDKPCPFMTNLGLGGYAKAFKDRKTDLDWLSVNEENVKTYMADNQCGHANTTGFWKEFMRGMRWIWTKKALQGIAKDEIIRITSGSDDPVGQMSKGVKWLETTYKELGIANVSLKLWEGKRHEIHNEDNYEEVYQDWANFILG